MNDVKIILGLVVITTLGTSILFIGMFQYAKAGTLAGVTLERKAPTAVTGDNIYVSWWSNKTGNDEVMFRASTDNGKTFGDLVNLSNTTNSDSQDVEIAAEGVHVAITWWERNQTSNDPVMITSNDAGKTFGDLIKLASNGTIRAE
jgi:hypothetical protein